MAVQASDKRDGTRRRTRLRSGKIADAHNRFIVECAVYDRSDDGARLRLAADLALPDPIRFYDDERNTLVEAAIVWRQGPDIGVRFAAHALPVAPAELAALQRRYYAVGRS